MNAHTRLWLSQHLRPLLRPICWLFDHKKAWGVQGSRYYKQCWRCRQEWDDGEASSL